MRDNSKRSFLKLATFSIMGLISLPIVSLFGSKKKKSFDRASAKKGRFYRKLAG